jgi:hypothetical protein
MTREEILGADDLPVREVPVPQWGEGMTVFLRTFTAEDNEQLTAIQGAPDADRIFLGRFAALSLCDGDGARLFTDADAGALGKKSLAALGLIMEAGQEHNGMTEAARAAVEKNSETSQE